MISRAKADVVLSIFNTINSPKILYSVGDRHYYVIIKDTVCYKEYYVSLDSSGALDKIRFVEKTKNKKVQKHYEKLLSEAEPIFDLSRYHSGFVTKVLSSQRYVGRLSYFVVKDIDGKRYGEYRLPVITAPSPIDVHLLVYLFLKLSSEMSPNSDNVQK